MFLCCDGGVCFCRSSSRAVYVGSLDMFTDSFLDQAGKNHRTFVSSLLPWIFGARGHLRYDNFHFHRVGEVQELSTYRVKDNLVRLPSPLPRRCSRGATESVRFCFCCVLIGPKNISCVSIAGGLHRPFGMAPQREAVETAHGVRCPDRVHLTGSVRTNEAHSRRKWYFYRKCSRIRSHWYLQVYRRIFSTRLYTDHRLQKGKRQEINPRAGNVLHEIQARGSIGDRHAREMEVKVCRVETGGTRGAGGGVEGCICLFSPFISKERLLFAGGWTTVCSWCILPLFPSPILPPSFSWCSFFFWIPVSSCR